MYEGLKGYKGYTIAKVTAKDWYVLDKTNTNITPSDKVSFRLQREAKEFIDNLSKITEESEEKEMTVKEMRSEAKEMGIKGYSRMSKEDLQKAIDTAKSVEEVTETESVETEEAEVVLKAFTGMVIGRYTAVYENGTYTLTTKKGNLKFDENGKQLEAKNPKFANKIEKC